jgi:2-(1,2-epoxy-1,2-dihydrophenyl)acetyl-CoA isomerase
MDSLSYDRVDETVVLTLNAPDTRNALSVEMANELEEGISAAEDNDARCVVVQGTGSTFCSGGDIDAMLEGVSEDIPIERRVEEFALPVNRAVAAVAECSLPTVAKVDGPAFGAGGALAIACDVILASERAKIGFGFRQMGLSVDSATSALLPSLVGENIAKELVYTGELLGPERARQLGLFNHVYPVDEFEQQARKVVDRIASGPTLALKQSKQLLEAGRDRSASEAIDAETDALAETLDSNDHAEGVRAFAQQEDPEFTGS